MGISTQGCYLSTNLSQGWLIPTHQDRLSATNRQATETEGLAELLYDPNAHLGIFPTLRLTGLALSSAAGYWDTRPVIPWDFIFTILGQDEIVWPGSPDVAAAPFQLIVVEQSASSMEGRDRG